MNLKISTTLCSALATLAATYLIWPEWYGLCETRVTTIGEICSSPLSYPYGVALLPFALAFLLLSMVSFAVSEKPHRHWLKFSTVYFLFAAIVIVLMENSAVGMAGISLSLADAGAWAIILTISYALISVAVLVISEVRQRAQAVRRS